MLLRGSRVLRRALLPGGVLLGVVVVWELAYRVFRIPTFVVPAPVGILAETWEWRWRLAGHAWVTLYETLAGFALSIAVGTPLAVLIVYSPLLRRALYPLLVVTQAQGQVTVRSLDGPPITAQVTTLCPWLEQTPFEQVIAREIPDPERLLWSLWIEAH